jgi:putative component of membrane protein insertase Oxa1/YidC/SpoIIIJ protein YidD
VKSVYDYTDDNFKTPDGELSQPISAFEQSGDSSEWKPISNPDAVEDETATAEITRPRYSLIATMVDFVTPYVIVWLMVTYTPWLPFNGSQAMFWLVFTGLYVLLRIKQILLWAILLYQRFAPIHIRERCVFTPTCSTYMFQAIQKYGTVAGAVKGIGRLLRCKETNRGTDELD